MDKIIKEHGIEKIKDVVKISNSFVDVLKKLGYDPKSKNIRLYYTPYCAFNQ